MKRKMAVILLLVCMAVAGCTAKGTGNEGDTEAAERMEDESAKSGVTDGEAGRDENAQQQRQAEPEAAVQEEDMEDSMLYRDAVLTREAPEDKVSILVQPSVLRTYSSYYYTPGGVDQEWLRQFMDSLPAGGESGTGLQKGLKETGWQIAYGDKCFMAFEGGYLQWSDVDEKGDFAEYFTEAPKLCDYIQIMLQEKLGYTSFEPADIKDIVSARLDIRSFWQ